MYSPTTRANFADALDPAVRKIFTDTDKELPYIYTQIFNISDSSKATEKDSSVSGLGTLRRINEGEAVTTDGPIQGYDTTYEHEKYGLKTVITEEMIDDAQFRVIEQNTKNIAYAGNRYIETSAANVFNNGWTAGGGTEDTHTSGGDSYALFYASHPRADGGTAISNTTSMDLAEDALETILVNMRATLDDRGQKMLVRPDTLIVPPALEREAKILLESSGRVGTANNDMNPYQGRLKLIVWDFLSSDTAFFVLDSKIHKINWFWRQRPYLKRNEDFDTGNIEYKYIARWSNGFSDWRGTYGSTGDNA